MGGAIDRFARSEPLWSLREVTGQRSVREAARTEPLTTLADAECQVFSQWGEDGIIEWIVSRLPGIPETFVEFGVEDYTEANTRFLLHNRNWRGLVMDASNDNVRRIIERSDHWRHDLTARTAFVTADNVDELITSAGFEGDVGLLSVDIDGNDYWVLQAVRAIRPWLVIVEYNAVLGDVLPLSIPYHDRFARSPTRGAGLYYGASIAAFEHWARECGYRLLGTNRAGCNAFFVRDDHAEELVHLVGTARPRPSRFRDARAIDGTLTMTSGLDRFGLLARLPLVDVSTGHDVGALTVQDVYSPAWATWMTTGQPPDSPAR
jgi:hypothetical protein